MSANITKLDRKTIEYAGISNPTSSLKIRLEIAGLRNAIKQAEELISRYEQVLMIARVAEEEKAQEEGGADAEEQSAT